MQNTAKPEVVRHFETILRAHQFDWFLCGSRSKLKYAFDFALEQWYQPDAYRDQQEADWDFAVKDHALLRSFLHYQGFQLKEISSYQDIMTDHVYERTDTNGTKIQVQIKNVDWYDTFKDVWENYVTPNMFYYAIWKRGPYTPHKDSIRHILEGLCISVKRKEDMIKELTWE